MTKEDLIVLLRNPDQIIQAVDDLKLIVEENPYFHVGHQLYIKGLQQTNQRIMERKLRIAAISVRDRTILYSYLNEFATFHKRTLPIIDALSEVITLAEEQSTSENKEQLETVVSPDALIEAFLSSNPKIVSGESLYEVDLSESMQDVTDIGTETLADIYAMQGNKEKAIKIYEQLILKYPEKNIYFAAQIKRLK